MNSNDGQDRCLVNWAHIARRLGTPVLPQNDCESEGKPLDYTEGQRAYLRRLMAEARVSSSIFQLVLRPRLSKAQSGIHDIQRNLRRP